MAKAYTNVNSTTGTFAGWLSKSNELFYDMSTMIVTVADVAAPNSSNESRTTGNADIQGIFSANNIVVWDTLAGGRNEEWANTDTLYIVSNTQIGNSSQTDTLTVYGDATFDANVQIGSAATDGLTIAANTVVNGLSFFTANTRFNDNARISFGTDSDTSLYHDGSDLKLIHNNANTSDFIIEDVSGNDVFTFTTDHSTFTVARYDDATDGPSIVLLDEGTTPDAANVGGIFFKGQDSGSAITEYAAIKGIAEDNTNTTEDGALLLYTTIGGTAKAMIAVNEASDTAVSLRFDGSEKLATKTDGVDITGELQSDSLDVDGVADISGVVTLGANANFGDADQANFGAAADLQIFHDATDSHIKDNGTGNLKISSSQIDFLGGADGAETMATMVDDGAVTLYHNNAVKFATLATGVVVTGDTGTDTLTVGGGYGSTGLAIAATGNIQTNGTLTVDGLATLNAGIAVDTNKFTVADTTGNVSTAGTLGVTGISTLGIINASGLASLDGGIDVDGAFTVTNTSGNIATSGTLGVTGISTLGVINASGLASLDAGIDVDGAFTVADTTGNVVTSGTLGVTGVSTLGIINASGLASLNGGIAVDANFTVNGTSGATVIGSTLNVTGTSTLVAINSSGLASLDGGINVNDDFTVDVNGNVVGVASTFSGLTSADGGIDVNTAKFTVAAAGDTVIAATTASTSSTTGALKVAGGTGIAGKLFVGDDANVAGNLVVDGTATFAGGGQLTVNNSIVTTLSVTGDTDIGSGASDTVTINARVDSDIVPSTDSARDLGTDALRWTHVYADNVHGIGTTLTALNASNIASGTIADARLPATISSDITGNAATVTNGVYLNTTQTISGAKTFSATTDFNGAVTLDGATTSSSSFTVDGGYVKLNDNINLNLGSNTDVEIYHDGTNLLTDINTGNFQIRDGADSNATRFTFTPSSSALEIKNADAGGSGPTITLKHDSASPAASDEAGQIFFQSDNDAAENVTYARIDALIADVSDGSEDGSLKLKVYQGGTLRDHITAESGVATLYHNGSAKLATASGGVTITGTATATTFSGSGASLTALPAASLTGNIASARLTSVPAASLTGNIDDDRLPASITSDITGTAAKVTVTDSTTNTNFPVVFHNESNGLLDDTGALRYNPSTGTLLVPNLAVAGTTTQVDTVTMNANNAIVFEGATPDDFETTLTITDPTADRTIALPNATGTIALTSSDITGNAATATTLATARTIGGTSFNGSADIAVALAATATTLATARDIGGVSFNGSASINLPGVNTAGNQDTSGTAAVATVATTVTITDNESTNENNAIVFTAGGDVDGGNLGLESDGTLTYNPSTGKITATGFVGALTGNADTVTNGVYTSRTLTAGTGLTGGGTLAADRTFAIDSTVTTLTGSQTLTNKTLTSPSIGTGFTFDGITITAVQTSGESFVDNNTSLMTSAAIDDRINAAVGVSALNDLSDAKTNSSGGTIGIGTDALANDDGSANLNTAIGYKAGEDVTSGAGNFFGGHSAGLNATTANNTIAIGRSAIGSGVLTGTDNTAIGYQAGYNATTADYTVAIGYSAIALGVLTGSDNIAIGRQAGYDLTSGNDNFFAGYNAGSNATEANYAIAIGREAIGTGVLIGTDNTAIGRQAGNDLTSGTNNVMMGPYAGANATTANNNVAIGLNAMRGNPSIGAVTGVSNVAVGENAGYDLTSGATNVFVGFKAGENVTTANNTIAIGRLAIGGLGTPTGTDNTAIGQLAGYDLTSGIANVMVGYGAGYNATEADYSIAIGYLAAGTGVLTGTDNIAIGRLAGTDLTSGANNTFIGLAAGTNVTTGGDNTILGPSAGDALTTGSNNIIIGHDAAASAVGVSNEITIGDTNVSKFRVPGLNFIIKDSTATEDYVLTVDASGEAGWEAVGGVTAVTVTTNVISGTILPVRDISLSASISGGTLTLTLNKTMTVDEP